MGKIKQGILGGYSGKVGPTTGSSWKGINIVKSRPVSVAYPGTAAQVSQTSKMTGIVAFSKLILSVWIKPLWDRFAVQSSGYNQFVKANIANFVDGNFPLATSLVMSQGAMRENACTAVPANPFSSCAVTWDNDAISDPLALSTDIAYVLIITATGLLVGSSSEATRAAETATVTFDATLPAGDYYAFLAFKAANGTRVSYASVDPFTVA